MRVFLIIVAVFMSACSLKTPPNNFQYNSVNAFSSYKSNFLSGDDLVAKNDISRAIKHAKRGADLNTLARIYLGECSLNISVGIDDKCSKYINIKNIVNDKSLDAYYNLITQNLKHKDITYLPKKYKKFAFYVYENQYNKAFKKIQSMQDISSQLVSSALIKESLDEAEILIMIDIASFYGYKKSVLFWLKNLEKISIDEISKENIAKKISILEANE